MDLTKNMFHSIYPEELLSTRYADVEHDKVGEKSYHTKSSEHTFFNAFNGVLVQNHS